MASVKDPLEAVDCDILTGKGKKSAKRGIDPKDTLVINDAGEEIKVRSAVTSYAQAMKKKKDAEEAAAAAADILKTYVGKVRDNNAVEGDYQKSYRVLGNKGHITLEDGTSVTFQYSADDSQNDRFLVAKKEVPDEKDPTKMIERPLTVKEVHDILGTDFDVTHEDDITISLKKSILDNKKERKEFSEVLVKAFGTEGIKKYFTKETVVVVKDGMAEQQYKLTKEQREKFQTVAVPYSDTLKAVTVEMD